MMRPCLICYLYNCGFASLRTVLEEVLWLTYVDDRTMGDAMFYRILASVSVVQLSRRPKSKEVEVQA